MIQSELSQKAIGELQVWINFFSFISSSVVIFFLSFFFFWFFLHF